MKSKAFQLLVFYCLACFSVAGQSSAAAIASATIVTSVGTESLKGDDDRMEYNLANVNSNSVIQQKVASIKLWNNRYSFDVILPKKPIVSINKAATTLVINDLYGKILQTDYTQPNSSTINIIGSLIMDDKFAPGLYSSKDPLQIIITFE